VFYFQLQLKDGVRQGAHLGDLSTEGFRTGLSQYGGGANLQDHIGAWLGLAWQAETIVQLVLRQCVTNELAFVEVRRLTKCLAGTAGGSTAAKTTIELGLACSICDGLTSCTRNELGDPVFEGQCNLVLSFGRHFQALLKNSGIRKIECGLGIRPCTHRRCGG